MLSKSSGLLFLLSATAQAQFFNFFGQQQQQQQQQQQPQLFEDTFLNNLGCQSYLCPDTQACVRSPQECPCPFPKSQLKCTLPDSTQFVCISKPATNDEKLAEMYDDPVKGPNAAIKGMRDCGWVQQAYKGLV